MRLALLRLARRRFPDGILRALCALAHLLLALALLLLPLQLVHLRLPALLCLGVAPLLLLLTSALENSFSRRFDLRRTLRRRYALLLLDRGRLIRDRRLRGPRGRRLPIALGDGPPGQFCLR